MVGGFRIFYTTNEDLAESNILESPEKLGKVEKKIISNWVPIRYATNHTGDVFFIRMKKDNFAEIIYDKRLECLVGIVLGAVTRKGLKKMVKKTFKLPYDSEKVKQTESYYPK